MSQDSRPALVVSFTEKGGAKTASQGAAKTFGPSLTLARVAEKAASLGAKLTDRRVIRTAALVLAMFSMGLYFRIVDPTLIDLKDRLGVGYEEISRVLAGHTVGYFLSAVAGYAFLVLGSSFFLAGVGTLGTPYATSLWGLVILQHIAGWGHGFTDTVLCTQLWGDRASVPLHATQAGYPLGSFAIQLIVIPFVSPDRTALNNNTASPALRMDHSVPPPFTVDQATPPPLTVDEARLTSHIQWPYAGVAAVQFAMFVLFFYFQYCGDSGSGKLRKVRETPQSLSAFFSPDGTDEQPHTVHGTYTIPSQPAVRLFQVSYLVESGMYGLHYPPPPTSVSYLVESGMYGIGHVCYTIPLVSYLVESGMYGLHYPPPPTSVSYLVESGMYGIGHVSYLVESGMYGKAEANVVYSSFWVCIAVMRWLSTAIAAWVPVSVMLSVEIVCLSAASVAMAFWGANNRPAFWVLTCVCGLVVAPIVPGGNAWANQNLEASPVVFALCLIGAAIGGTASSSAAGYLFEHVGPRSTLYMFMGCCCALLLVFTIMQLSVSSVWDKMSSRKEKSEKATEAEAGVTENLCSQSNAC
ncbi:hypothetical protein Bbelb_347190 [Branchiostoma belcheri]|nr:hypothetical protein Bbelb_347190 [Branchiostoma belcheri]